MCLQVILQTRALAGGDIQQKNGFIAEEFDEDTGLNYLNARYYESERGQFLSQDPVFWSVTDEKKLKEYTNKGFAEYYSDPQGMNSYSYARNNPLTLKDPSGLWFQEILTGKQTYAEFEVELGQASLSMSEVSPVLHRAIAAPVVSGITVGVISGVAAATWTTSFAVYGIVDTVDQVMDFTHKTYTQPDRYTEHERNMAGGNLYINGLGSITSYFAPPLAKAGISAVTTLAGVVTDIASEIADAENSHTPDNNNDDDE